MNAVSVDEVITEYDERNLTTTLPQLVDSRAAARAVFDAVAAVTRISGRVDDDAAAPLRRVQPGCEAMV